MSEAEDGLTAISAAKLFRASLLTLDIAMLYAQGVAVYAEVKHWSPDTKGVVFTGVTPSSLLREMMQAGVLAFLQNAVMSLSLSKRSRSSCMAAK